MAQDLSAKKANFVSRHVQDVETLLDATDRLIARRLEYDATGYGPGTGSDYEITEADLANGNAHLTPAAIADSFSSLEALKALLVQGHLTNLNKLRR